MNKRQGTCWFCWSYNPMDRLIGLCPLTFDLLIVLVTIYYTGSHSKCPPHKVPWQLAAVPHGPLSPSLHPAAATAKHDTPQWTFTRMQSPGPSLPHAFPGFPSALSIAAINAITSHWWDLPWTHHICSSRPGLFCSQQQQQARLEEPPTYLLPGSAGSDPEYWL